MESKRANRSGGSAAFGGVLLAMIEGLNIFLTKMLADPTPTVVQQALLVLGNLCSDSVDPSSAVTKALLLELARRSLERKQAAQFKVVTNAAHSQHAHAIKGLERGAGSRGGSQHELAQRALERAHLHAARHRIRIISACGAYDLGIGAYDLGMRCI